MDQSPRLNSVPLRRLIKRHGNLGYAIVGVHLLGFWLLHVRRRQTLLAAGVTLTAISAFLLCPVYTICRAHNAARASLHTPVTPHTTYRITDLGVVDDFEFSYGNHINTKGQTAGLLTDREFKQVRGFFSTSGQQMQDIGTLNGDFTLAVGLNDDGQVVGVSRIQKREFRSFVWQDGKRTNIGTLGGPFCVANAINNRGQIAGISLTGDSQAHSFIWKNGEMADIGKNCPGKANGASAINDDGVVVGFTSNGDGKIGGYVYSNNRARVLPSLGGDVYYPLAISRTHAVGVSTLRKGEDKISHGCVWGSGEVRDIGTLGGDSSFAAGVDDAGTVVGAAQTADGRYHAIAWRSGEMTDLNTLVPANSGWQLVQASGINSRGQIVGTGVIGRAFHGFILTPQQ